MGYQFQNCSVVESQSVVAIGGNEICNHISWIKGKEKRNQAQKEWGGKAYHSQEDDPKGRLIVRGIGRLGVSSSQLQNSHLLLEMKNNFLFNLFNTWIFVGDRHKPLVPSGMKALSHHAQASNNIRKGIPLPFPLKQHWPKNTACHKDFLAVRR